MYVDVDGMRVGLQEYEVGRGDPVGNQLLVGLHHRLVEVGAAEIAAVHEHELVAEGLPGRVGAADVALELEHGEVFDDALLDRLESVVVVVEDLLGVLEVEVVLADLLPGQLQHEVKVVVLHAVVGRRGVVLLQFRELLLEDFGDLLGPLLRCGPLLEAVEFLGVVHSELLLDGAELVVEVVFPLLLVDLALHLLVDLLLDLHEFDLHVEHREQLEAAHLDVVVLEQVHLRLEVLNIDGGRDEIHEEAEVVDGLHRPDGLARAHIGAAENLDGPVLDGFAYCLYVSAVVVLPEDVGEIVYARVDIGVVGDHAVDFQALERLEYGRDGAVRHVEGLDDLAHGAVAVEVLLLGLLHHHVLLRDRADEESVLLGVAYQLDGLVASYGYGEDGPREQDCVAQRQYGEHVGEFRLVYLYRIFALQHRDDAYLRPGR